MTIRPPGRRRPIRSAKSAFVAYPAVREQQVERAPAGHDRDSVAGDHLDSLVRGEQVADLAGELLVKLGGHQRAVGRHGGRDPACADPRAGAELADQAAAASGGQHGEEPAGTWQTGRRAAWTGFVAGQRKAGLPGEGQGAGNHRRELLHERPPGSSSHFTDISAGP
jgi:hypothetical protein